MTKSIVTQFFIYASIFLFGYAAGNIARNLHELNYSFLSPCDCKDPSSCEDCEYIKEYYKYFYKKR